MKRIKPVVLKDATKLTNSEMKKIRGGYEPEQRPTSCTVQCPIGSASVDCEKLGFTGMHCEIISGAGVLGVGCISKIHIIHGAQYCIEPEV